VLLLALALLPVAANAGLNVKVSLNYDSTVSTLYRDGDKPQGGSCPTGFTCAAIGTAPLCDVSKIDDDTVDIAVVSQNEEVGGCAVYKTASTDQDLHIEVEFDSLIEGFSGNYTTVAAFIHEGTTTANTTGMHSSWQALGANTRICKFSGGDVDESGQFGGAGTIPEIYLLQYDDSTDTIQCAYGTNGSDWTQIGNDTTDTLTFPVKYGVIATSYNATVSSTLRADLIVADATLETIGTTPTPGTSDTPAYSDPLVGVTLLGGRNAVAVANTAELDAALPGTCGDTITLADGTYTGNKTLSTQCPANNPIIITGSGDYGETASGKWHTTGNQYIVKHLKFSGSGAQVKCQGTNNHILANKFSDTRGSAIQLTGEKEGNKAVEEGNTQQCEVAYNSFTGPGSCTTAQTTFGQAIRMSNGPTGVFSAQEDVWIHHNYIFDWSQPPNVECDQNDMIEFGEAPYVWVTTTGISAYVEDNIFDNFKNTTYGGIIDQKIGGNYILRNTFINSANGAAISHRQGVGSVWEGNYVEGGKMLMRNDATKAVCNYLAPGSTLKINAGKTEANSTTNSQPRCEACLAAGNIGALEVGYDANGIYTQFPALNTVVEAHTGAYSVDFETGTVTTNKDVFPPTSYNCTPAVKLNLNQVGPGAESNASAAYKAARGL
jgi:hypothetical protein